MPEPEDAGPDQPIPSGKLSVKPTPPAPGTTNPVEKEPVGGQPGSTPGQEATAEPGDRPGTTPRPQPAGKPSETQKEQREAAGAQTVVVSADNGRLVLSGEPVATGNVKGMTDTSTVLALIGICCFVWLAVILLIMVVLFVLLRKKKEEEEE